MRILIVYNFNYAHAELNVYVLSFDVAAGSEITPCNKIDKPLVVYAFSGNIMKSRFQGHAYGKSLTFSHQDMISK